MASDYARSSRNRTTLVGNCPSSSLLAGLAAIQLKRLPTEIPGPVLCVMTRPALYSKVSHNCPASACSVSINKALAIVRATVPKNDFESKLCGYRTAFRALKNYDFIDTNQVYILGISNGGRFAPLVPETDMERAQVRGYIAVGGWVKTWFEHMLEIERRRFGLMGKSPAEVNDRMKGAATLYHDWLIEDKTVDQILREHPQLAELWPEGKDHAHLYGRPLTLYQQLQKLNLAAAWSRVNVPTLVLHGQYDWIMSRKDHELIAQLVNANRLGAARFVEVPEMGHTFQHYLSFADAFHGTTAEFDPKVLQLLIDWLKRQQPKNNVTISPSRAARRRLNVRSFSEISARAGLYRFFVALAGCRLRHPHP